MEAETTITTQSVHATHDDHHIEGRATNDNQATVGYKTVYSPMGGYTKSTFTRRELEMMLSVLTKVEDKHARTRELQQRVDNVSEERPVDYR